MLRDHGEPARVDQVWSRLERNLALSPADKTARSPRGWPLLAAAALALFVAGYVLSSAINDRPVATPVPTPEQPDEGSAHQIFAAAAEARMYPLPGGGFIQVEPDSIVDVVSHGQQGLTLRLVRGGATVDTMSETHGRRTTNLALQVGRAEVVTASGSMRVRLDGDNADLRVLWGTASLSAPDEEVKHRVLEPGLQRVRVAVVTASLAPTAMAPMPVEAPSEPDSVVMVEGADPAPLPAPAPARPAWVLECEKDNYAEAVRLLESVPGGASTALAWVTDPELLTCIGSGHEANGKTKDAIAINERILLESSDPDYRMVAAAYLARLHRAAGNKDQAAHYERIRQQEAKAKSALQSAEGLCESIQAAHKAKNLQERARLSKHYRQKFPDGDCIDTIDKLEAELPAPKGQPKGSAKDEPLDEEEDETGEAGPR
jgi:ferric-dicitrate binding protein FerR (iron transport regulator)